MRSTIEAIHQQQPIRVVVAVPIAAHPCLIP
jgi:predicted phosphoribosyltransferase